MVEVEVKEGGEGQTHKTSCARRTSCRIELNIIKSVMGATGEEILGQSLNYILRIAF